MLEPWLQNWCLPQTVKNRFRKNQKHIPCNSSARVLSVNPADDRAGIPPDFGVKRRGTDISFCIPNTKKRFVALFRFAHQCQVHAVWRLRYMWSRLIAKVKVAKLVALHHKVHCQCFPFRWRAMKIAELQCPVIAKHKSKDLVPSRS